MPQGLFCPKLSPHKNYTQKNLVFAHTPRIYILYSILNKNFPMISDFIFCSDFLTTPFPTWGLMENKYTSSKQEFDSRFGGTTTFLWFGHESS